jgi:hypothetical protein
MGMGVIAVPTLQLIIKGKKDYDAIGGMAATRLSNVFHIASVYCDTIAEYRQISKQYKDSKKC